MIRVIFFIICIGLAYSGNAQSPTCVSRVALFEGAKEIEDPKAMMDYCDAQFDDYMHARLDTSICLPMDTSYQYDFRFSVSKKGAIEVLSVTSQENGDCLAHFKSLTETFVDEVEFIPARREGFKVASNKSFSITYPPLDSTVYKMDSMGHYLVTEQFPVFSGTEDMIGSKKDKKSCSDLLMIQFLYQSLRYPDEARENRIQGMEVVAFVIDTLGFITEPNIVRDIGGGCDQAVLDVLDDMNSLNPPFTPATQFGKKVKMKYTLPVRFKLRPIGK